MSRSEYDTVIKEIDNVTRMYYEIKDKKDISNNEKQEILKAIKASIGSLIRTRNSVINEDFKMYVDMFKDKIQLEGIKYLELSNGKTIDTSNTEKLEELFINSYILTNTIIDTDLYLGNHKAVLLETCKFEKEVVRELQEDRKRYFRDLSYRNISKTDMENICRYFRINYPEEFQVMDTSRCFDHILEFVKSPIKFKESVEDDCK